MANNSQKKVISGKTALVTGASSGIGESTVRQFLRAGVTVYAAARRVDKMKDLEKAGAKIIFLDVMSEESMLAAVNEITAKEGSVDILVNNAGYGSFGAIEDVPLEEARRQFEVNIFGLARLTQLVLPGMRNNKFGKIVNISSMGGKVYTPFGGWYHATKHALEGFSDCLRLEVKEFGIDVVVVEPGGIKTPWGLIAAENLRKTSGKGDYALAALKGADGMDKMYTGNGLSSPELIGRTILKSVSSRRPKTRYLIGYGAKPGVFIRNTFGDKVYDRLIRKMM